MYVYISYVWSRAVMDIKLSLTVNISLDTFKELVVIH